MEELQVQLQELEIALRMLLEKSLLQDQRISQLENLSLMYRRPTESDHEVLSDTLDYLHNNVEGIKKDLSRLAGVV